MWWIIPVFLILICSVALIYKLGFTSGYKRGFHYGYENNPIRDLGIQTIHDIKTWIVRMEIKDSQSLKILKQLKALEQATKTK